LALGLFFRPYVPTCLRLFAPSFFKFEILRSEILKFEILKSQILRFFFRLALKT